MRRKKNGDPITIQYFRERSIVDPETGCWNWQKATSQHGYGVDKGTIAAIKNGKTWRSI